MILRLENLVPRSWQRGRIQFGTIAVILLAAAVLIAGMIVLVKPGWGNPLAAFVRRLMYLSFLSAPVFGVLGVIFDRRKFFAIAASTIVVAVVLYLFICNWLATAYSNMLS